MSYSVKIPTCEDDNYVPYLREAKLYEELRKIIDGGSESMTHEDAVAWCNEAADAMWYSSRQVHKEPV